MIALVQQLLPCMEPEQLRPMLRQMDLDYIRAIVEYAKLDTDEAHLIMQIYVHDRSITKIAMDTHYNERTLFRRRAKAERKIIRALCLALSKATDSVSFLS